MRQYNEIYNYDSQLILEQYGNENFTMFSTSLIEDDKKTSSFRLLCGSEIFDNIIVAKNQNYLIISVKKNFGDVKVLAYNHKDDSIITTILQKGKNEIILNEGEYQLYVIGHHFCGSIQIEK